MAVDGTRDSGYLAVGQIVGPHGIRGEVKVTVLSDFPGRFHSGATVHVGSDAGAVPMTIKGSRPHKGFLLVQFAAVPDRNAAELLRDQYLLIPEDQAMPLGEHENFVHDLLGMAVETTAGEALGRVSEILFTKANDVYVVAGPEGELLLPALRSVILSVDVPKGKMVVALPDGLRDLPDEDDRDLPEERG